MFFAGTLLRNYMNQAGQNPFIVNGVKASTTWILATLERLFGRPAKPPLPAGQLQGKLPPAPGGGLPPWPQGGGAAPQMPQVGLPPPPPQWNGT